METSRPSFFDPNALRAALAAVPESAWSLPSTYAATGVHHGNRRIDLVDNGRHLPAAQPWRLILDAFARVYTSWLSWLDPGGFIAPHRDAGTWRERWQVPIQAAGLFDGDRPQGGAAFPDVGEQHVTASALALRDGDDMRVSRVMVADVGFVADFSGALFWEEQSLLVVSDLHLEKGSSFAAQGVLLPPYDTVATLSRLAAVIARHDPRQVIALGDSFHDRDAHARLSEPDREALAALQVRRNWIWISGNHDPALPTNLGGVVATEVAIGPDSTCYRGVCSREIRQLPLGRFAAGMDLALWAHNHGRPASELAAALGMTEQQAALVYADIEAKRRTSRNLHLSPQLVKPVGELDGI